jgi:hypothetical protein
MPIGRTHDRIVIAHHLVATLYGHWLSNDPRGSASTETRRPELDDLGPVHFGRERIQPPKKDIKDFYRRAEPRLPCEDGRKIRNPKHEIRNKDRNPNRQARNETGDTCPFRAFYFGRLNLFRMSFFGIRTSIPTVTSRRSPSAASLLPAPAGWWGSP